MRIAASQTLAAPREAVFAFLANGRNHHMLAGRHIRLLELRENGEAGLRAVMIIRGPLGIRRTAHTLIENSHEPALVAGTARVGSRTTARVRWDLSENGHGSTRVVLSATVRSSGPLDRFLLTVGATLWMRRLFVTTLGLLAAHTEKVLLIDTRTWPPALSNDPRETRRASA